MRKDSQNENFKIRRMELRKFEKEKVPAPNI
jgi:hypothetical protein